MAFTRAVAVRWLTLAATLMIFESATMATSHAQEERNPADPGFSAASTSTSGSIRVLVQLAGLPGVAPQPGAPTPAPQVLGAAVVTARVQVVDPLAPDAPLVEQVTDASGQAGFDVAPGSYWVVVPWSSQVASLAGTPVVPAYLPNGAPVQAWQQVTVTSGTTTCAVLTITGAMP
jgi:hypothetical protein